jgi:hypothetical protein
MNTYSSQSGAKLLRQHATLSVCQPFRSCVCRDFNLFSKKKYYPYTALHLFRRVCRNFRCTIHVQFLHGGISFVVFAVTFAVCGPFHCDTISVASKEKSSALCSSILLAADKVESLQEDYKKMEEEPHGLIGTINDDDDNDAVCRPICHDALSAASKKSPLQ